MTDNLLTPFEKKKRAKYQKVCRLFAKLRKENPTATTNRILVAIANEVEMSTMGIKSILKNNGLYETTT